MEERELLEYLRKKTKDSAEDYQTLMNPESREKLKKIWDEHHISIKKGKPDFDNMLDNIHQKVGLSKKQLDRKKLLFLYSANIFKRVAVILFIPLLGAMAYFLLFFPPLSLRNSETMLEITTLPGTVTRLILGDSTHVWLNQSTTFRYPQEFKGDDRSVSIVEGEAYFEVVSDKDRPFIVNNSMMGTIVTGTKFNINASAERGVFEASLLEGSITLENSEHKLKMNPGYLASYNAETKSLSYHEKPVALSISWVNGELIFQDEPLHNVFYKLGNWYHVDFVLNDDKLKNMLFTAKVRFESLEQFLESMEKTLPIQYTIKEDKSIAKRVVHVRGY